MINIKIWIYIASVILILVFAPFLAPMVITPIDELTAGCSPEVSPYNTLFPFVFIAVLILLGYLIVKELEAKPE